MTTLSPVICCPVPPLLCAGHQEGHLPKALNRTLAQIADYAKVRKGTWNRDVRGHAESALQKELRESGELPEFGTTEEADRLLGKRLFDIVLEQWPQLRRVVEQYANAASHSLFSFFRQYKGLLSKRRSFVTGTMLAAGVCSSCLYAYLTFPARCTRSLYYQQAVSN